MTHIPFNGDTFIGPEIRKLIERFKVRTIIETGTWSAHTTRELAKMGCQVYTIDSTWDHLFEEFGQDAVRDLETRWNVRAVLGDSSKDLIKILAFAAEPVLFYLDAHGGGANGSNVNPLLEELDQIILHMDRWVENDEFLPVIVIHDFFVPGQEWGHNGGDWGRGYEPLSLELIAPYLAKIYPNGPGWHYNTQANGATRGVIFTYPGGVP